MITLYWDIEKKYDQIIAELYEDFKEKLNDAHYTMDDADIYTLVKSYIIEAIEQKRNQEETVGEC